MVVGAVIEIKNNNGIIIANVKQGRDFDEFESAILNSYKDRSIGRDKVMKLFNRISRVVWEFSVEVDEDIINKK